MNHYKDKTRRWVSLIDAVRRWLAFIDQLRRKGLKRPFFIGGNT